MNFFILIILFFTGCMKQSTSIESVSENFIYPTYDSVYDVEILNDTLYVANGKEGLKVFEIKNNSSLYLSSIYSGYGFSEGEDLISIETTTNFEYLFLLDKFNYTTARLKESLFIDGSDMFTQSACYNYQSRSTILEEGEGTNPQILTLNRKIDQFDATNRSTSIGKIIFTNELWYIDKDCSQEVLSDLSYDLSDLKFDNNRLFLANSNPDTTSIQIFSFSDETIDLIAEDTLSVKPNTINVYGNYYVAGLSGKSGCYIALLDNNDIHPKFSIADGFSIREVHYSNNRLILSAGYGGVLVYEWSDLESKPQFLSYIASGYAYSARLFNVNKIIVGTKNGIEIYEI